MLDMHVVCLYRQIELARFFQHVVDECLVGQLARARVACKICHIALQLQIVDVDRGEKGCESSKRGQHGDCSRDAPARDLGHVRSDSLPVAQSSTQISSEWGVHSALVNPEIWSSSSFRVPCP